MRINNAMLVVLAGFALAAAAPVAHAATPQAQSVLEARASDLIGDAIEDSRGWEVGTLVDLLVDPADSHIVFAVINAGSRFEAPTRSLALALPDAKVIAFDGNLRVDMTLHELKRLPALDDVLDSLEPAQKARLVSVKALVDASLQSASGSDLGSVNDAIVDIAHARMAYITADFDTSWKTLGKPVSIAKPALRGKGDDMAVIADARELRSAPEWTEAGAQLANQGLWSRFKRWIGLN